MGRTLLVLPAFMHSISDRRREVGCISTLDRVRIAAKSDASAESPYASNFAGCACAKWPIPGVKRVGGAVELVDSGA
jgi:hypothetical protein